MNININTTIIRIPIQHFDIIDSTNKYLMNNNVKNGTTVLTDYQTAGRGRMSRKWEARKSESLLFSIALNKKLEMYKPHSFTFLASLGVYEGIKNIFPDLPISLKWPNDVLINKKKVCGILVESKASGGMFTKVVIGIGLNVNQGKDFFNTNALKTGTSLKIELESKYEVDRERILESVLSAMDNNLIFGMEQPDQIQTRWKKYCPYISSEISIFDGEKNIKGIFKDVSNDGGLILRKDGIDQIFYAGDVSINKEFI